MALQKVPSTFIPDRTQVLYAYRSSSQTISNITDTTIIYDTASTNIDTAYDTTTGIWTAPQSGYYHVIGAADYNSFVTLTVGIRQIYIYKNNSIIISKTTRANEIDPFVSSNSEKLVYCAAGDTLRMRVYQTTGNNIITRNPGTFRMTTFSIYLVKLEDTNPITANRPSENMVTDSSSTHVFKGRRNTSQSFTNAATHLIAYNEDVYDPDNALNTGTGVWTAPYTGKYYLSAGVAATTSAGGNGARFIWLQLNASGANVTLCGSADNNYAGGLNIGFRCSTVCSLTVGDTVQVHYSQSTGSTQTSDTSNGGNRTFFEGFLLGVPK